MSKFLNTLALSLAILLTGTWLFATDWPQGGDGFTDPTATNTWTADQTYDDDTNITFGTDGDMDLAFISADGDLVLDTQVVGTGHFKVTEGTYGAGALTSNTANVISTDDGASGSGFGFYHNSSSPADADLPAIITMWARDSASTPRRIAQIRVRFVDVTSNEMDSDMIFSTMNAANVSNDNTNAFLNSIGEWTNASGQSMKRYDNRSFPEIFGNDVLSKVSSLRVGRWTHPDNPVNDAKNIYGFGPTAEEFWDAFSLGSDPRKLTLDTDRDGVADTALPGIGTGSMGGILMAAIQELTKENKKLKTRLDALEVQ